MEKYVRNTVNPAYHRLPEAQSDMADGQTSPAQYSMFGPMKHKTHLMFNLMNTT